MDSKIEMMSQMVAGMLQNIVDEQVAKNTTTNLDSVLEFIKNASSEDITKIFFAVRDDNKHSEELFDNYYQGRLRNDDSVVNKDDLGDDEVKELVSDHDLESEIAEDYYGNLGCYDLKEKIKDLIDNL